MNFPTFQLLKVNKILEFCEIPRKKFFLSTILVGIEGVFKFLELRLIVEFIQTISSGDNSTHSILRSFLPNYLVDAHGIPILISAFFVVKITAIFLRYESVLMVERQAEKSKIKLRRSLYKKILHMNQSFFVRQSFIDLQNHLLIYSEKISSSIVVIHKSISDCLTFIAYLAVLLFIEWKVVIIAIALFSVSTHIFKLFNNVIRKQNWEVTRDSRDIGFKLYNVLINLNLVQAYSQEAKEVKYFEDTITKEAKSTISSKKTAITIDSAQQVLNVIILVVFIASISFIVDGDTGGSRTLILTYLFRRMNPLFGSIGKLSNIIASIERFVEASKKEILENSADSIKNTGKDKIATDAISIEFKHVTFSYEKHQKLLENKSFFIPSNQITILSGKSGSGKSTITNLILRFLEPQSGEILLANQPIKSINVKNIRKNISYINQNIPLFHESIEYNVCYGSPKTTKQNLYKALEAAQISELVHKLPKKEETIIGERGVRLSGGEKQRIALARAFLNPAPILILDEATSMLDMETEEHILENIKKMQHQKTIIIIGHTRFLLDFFNDYNKISIQ